jgi:hypothetical protein
MDLLIENIRTYVPLSAADDSYVRMAGYCSGFIIAWPLDHIPDFCETH